MAQEGVRPPVKPGDMRVSGHPYSEGSADPAQREASIGDKGKWKLPRLPRLFGEVPSLEERARIVDIREGVPTPEDANRMLRWASNPDTRGHLVPAPRLPSNWNDQREVGRCEQELIRKYEEGYEKGEIIPLFAENAKGEAVGTATIRLKNDKYLRLDGKTAVVEAQYTDPELQDQGIGSQLMLDIMHRVFVQRKMDRIKLWTMTDVEGWHRTYKFYERLGFKIDRGPYRHYSDLVEKRGIQDDRPEALLMTLRRDEAAAFLRQASTEDSDPDTTEVVATPDRNSPQDQNFPQA